MSDLRSTSSEQAVGQLGDRGVLGSPCLPYAGGPFPYTLGVSRDRVDRGTGDRDVEYRHRTFVLGRGQSRPGRVRLAHPLVRVADLETWHAAVQRQMQSDQRIGGADGRHVAL